MVPISTISTQEGTTSNEYVNQTTTAAEGTASWSEVMGIFSTYYNDISASDYYEFNAVYRSNLTEFPSGGTVIDYYQGEINMQFDTLTDETYFEVTDTDDYNYSFNVDMQNKLLYVYSIYEDILYKEIVTGDDLNDFVDLYFSQDSGFYVALSTIMELSESTVFQILGQNMYGISLSIYDLFENHYEYAAYTLGLIEPAASTNDYYVDLTFNFNSGIRFIMEADRYPLEFLGIRLYTEIFYDEQMEIVDAIEPRTINEDYYYETTFSNPEYCDRTYETDVMHKVLVVPESDNYFKLELDPGLYNVNLYWDFSNKFHGVLYDSEMKVCLMTDSIESKKAELIT